METAAKSDSSRKAPRKRRRRAPKIAIAALAILGCLLLLLALIALPVAEALAPGWIERAAADEMKGAVRVGRVDLSWTGPQRIERFEIYDEHATLVGVGEASATTSLLSFLRGSRDLGVVTVTGRFDLAAPEGGGVLDAVAPRPPRQRPADRPASALPRSLRAKIVLENVVVTYADARIVKELGEPIGLSDLDGEIEFAVGAPLTLTLTGQTLDGAGALDVSVSIENLTNDAGELTPDLARADARLDASLGARQARAALGRFVPIEDVLGEQVDLVLALQGGLREGQAIAQVAGTGEHPVRGDVAIEYGDGRLRLAQPAVATAPVTQAAVDRWVAPGAGGASVTLDRPFQATITIERLDLPLPTASAPLDLRGASALARFESGEISGDISVGPGRSAPAATGAQSFRIAPLSAVMEAPDFAGPVSLRAATSAEYAGDSAGALTVNLVAEGLLDGQGRPGADASPSLRGEAALIGAATTLAQPFIDAQAIDLSRDVGPTIDLSLRATDSDGPGTRLDFSARAPRLSFDGALLFEEGRVRSMGDGLAGSWDSPAALLNALLSAPGGAVTATVERAGPVEFTLRDLDLPITDGAPELERAAGRFEARARDVLVRFPGSNTLIETKSLEISAETAAGAPVALRLAGDHASDGRAFTSRADAELSGLFTDRAPGAPGAAPLTIRADGAVTGAPTALLAAALSESDAALAAEALGPSIDLDFEAGPADGAAGATWGRIDLRAQRADAQIVGVRAASGAVEVAEATASANATPRLVERLAARFAPDVEAPPSLAAPVGLTLSARPFTIPASADGALDVGAIAEIDAELRATGDVFIRGVPVGAESPATLGARDLSGRLRIAPAADGDLEFSLSTAVFDPAAPGAPFASLEVAATRAGAPGASGGLHATARLIDIDTERADRAIARPGLLALSLGSPASVVVDANRRSEADATALTIELSSPRLSTRAGLALTETAVALAAPLRARWTIDERWAARYLAPPGAVDGPSALRIVGDTPVELHLERAAFGLRGALLRDDVFEIDARLSAPSLRLAAQGAGEMRYRDISATVRSGAAPASVAVSLSADGDDGARVRLTADVANLASEAGVPTPGAASATIDAEGAVPGALIDALAKAGGRVAELLGERVAFDVDANDFSALGGELAASMRSERAEASLEGAAGAGALLVSRPARLEISTITPRLGELAIAPLFPLIGTIEKRPGDGPALIEAAELTLPLDGDVRKLSGVVTLSLGRVRYSAAPFFGDLLILTNNDPQSLLFRDWPPVVLNIRAGVATYQKVAFPMGDFTLETRGTVDFVQKRVDIITYVPLLALVDEVTRVAGVVPGVTRDTLIPLRTTGRFGALKTEPALDLLAKEEILNPQKIIDELFKVFERERRR